MKELRDLIVYEFNHFAQDSEMACQKGNKAAGARSRKQTLTLEKLFKQWRKDSVAAGKK